MYTLINCIITEVGEPIYSDAIQYRFLEHGFIERWKCFESKDDCYKYHVNRIKKEMCELDDELDLIHFNYLNGVGKQC